MDYTSLGSNLQKEYREAYERIELYARLNGVRDDAMEDGMLNLYDMLYSAQQEQKPVEKIVGDDLNAFSEAYFQQEYTKQEKIKLVFKKLYNIAKNDFICVLAMTVLVLLDEESHANFFTASINITTILGGIVCGIAITVVMTVIMDAFIRPAAIKDKNARPVVYYLIVTGLFVLFFILFLIVFFHVTDNFELPLSVPLFPFILVFGLYMAVYKGVMAVGNHKKYGTVYDLEQRTLKMELKREQKQKSQLEFERAALKGLISRYERLAKKKGMTKEAFHELFEKENRILDIYMPVFFSLIVIGFTCKVALDGSTWYDTLIFFFITAVLELGIYRLIIYPASASRKKICSICREQGINLIDYANERLKEN